MSPTVCISTHDGAIPQSGLDKASLQVERHLGCLMQWQANNGDLIDARLGQLEAGFLKGGGSGRKDGNDVVRGQQRRICRCLA